MRDLWMTRAYYFVCFGGSGFIFPFLNLFYARLGMTGTQIGWIIAAGSAVALIVAPIWTNRNDRWHNPRGMLQLSLVLSAFGFLWLGQQTLFLGVIIVTLVRTFVGAGIVPLSDSLAMAVTGTVRKGFGTVRVWHSAGWIVAVLSGGWLIERTGVETGLIAVSIAFFIGAFILFFIDSHNFSTPQAERVPLKQVIGDVLRHPAMIAVALMIVITGIANSGVLQFEAVYLDSLGASETIIGITSMVGAVVELPVMLWTDRLVARYGPYRLLIMAVVMSAALRLMVLIFPLVPVIMLSRALAGIAFSFTVIAMIRFVGDQTVPPRTRTVLALYNVTLPSFIGIVGPPFAGAVFDLVGARALYAIALVGYIIGWGVLVRSSRRREALAFQV